MLDSCNISRSSWIVRGVKFSRLYLKVGVAKVADARWVADFLLDARFVTESLTLDFGRSYKGDMPYDIGTALMGLDSSHDTLVRCLTLSSYELDERFVHTGDIILDDLSPLLSHFSSSVLEKIELIYELTGYYAEFVERRIAPIEKHLILLERERRGPGCRLEVVVKVKVKQHKGVVNSDVVSEEEQYEQRKNTVDKFGDALKSLRACRPGGRLLLENHSSDKVIALIMRVRFE